MCLDLYLFDILRLRLLCIIVNGFNWYINELDLMNRYKLIGLNWRQLSKTIVDFWFFLRWLFKLQYSCICIFSETCSITRAYLHMDYLKSANLVLWKECFWYVCMLLNRYTDNYEKWAKYRSENLFFKHWISSLQKMDML